MKTGISLPWNYLSEIYTDTESRIIYEVNRNPAEYLSLIKSWGADSVEYRHWPENLENEVMIRSFMMVCKSGLNITIHGETEPDHDKKDIRESFPWLMPLLETCSFSSRNPVIAAIHPVKTLKGNVADNRKKTASVLGRYCSDIEKYSLPVVIAYENQRDKEFVDPAVRYEDVADTVDEISYKSLGICWDMGHGFSNYKSGVIEKMPPPSFIEKTVHTHIHALSLEKGATHWPLSHGKLPIEKYAGLLLDNNYSGYFNLELSADRFPALDINAAFKNSIQILKDIEIKHLKEE